MTSATYPLQIKVGQHALYRDLDHAHSAILNRPLLPIIAINPIFNGLIRCKLMAYVSPERPAHRPVSISRSHCSLPTMDVPDGWPGRCFTGGRSWKNPPR